MTTHPLQAPAAGDGRPADSALYRRVWRWHFYAGLICLPFLVLLALTGGLYLFKDPIEHWAYAALREAPVRPGPAQSAEALVAQALRHHPGEPVRYVAPAGPGRSAEVGIRDPRGVAAVYLDPVEGRVLGTLRDDERLMDVVRRLHSLAIAGPVANHGIEVVAGWSIVLVVSGVFLWWPRGRRGGVLSVRAGPRRRLWWRDLHAVTGALAAAVILFLAVTGMPWSAFWGEQFGRLATGWGLGMPPGVWGGAPVSQVPSRPLPPSPVPLQDLTALAWSASHAPLPLSGTGEGPAPSDIGLDGALARLAGLGLPPGTPLRLPAGPEGVYSAMHFPDDVRQVRVVHLDRYSGAVLADIGYADYGVLAKLTEWGISLHTGRQFGWANLLLMLVGCLSIVLLALSGVVMWWKRRPRGRLAAPPRRAGDRAAMGAIAVALLLGLLYPLLGASMLVALAIDALLPRAWRQRLGW